MFTFALLSLPAVVYMLYALMGSAAIVGFATLAFGIMMVNPICESLFGLYSSFSQAQGRPPAV